MIKTLIGAEKIDISFYWHRPRNWWWPTAIYREGGEGKAPKEVFSYYFVGPFREDDGRMFMGHLFRAYFFFASVTIIWEKKFGKK